MAVTLVPSSFFPLPSSLLLCIFNAQQLSTDFTGANLRGANFTKAKAGLQKRWAIFLVMISWLILGMSGFIYLYNGRSIPQIFHFSKTENLLSGWVTIVGTIIIFFIILWERIINFIVPTVIVLSTIAKTNLKVQYSPLS